LRLRPPTVCGTAALPAVVAVQAGMRCLAVNSYRTRKVRRTMTASEAAAYLSTHGTPVFGNQLLAALNGN
jgi:hypothetical protein